MTAPLNDTGPPETGRDLMMRQRLSAGDVDAIAECYRTYGPLVRRYVARFVAHHEVDDVTQAVFYELWRSAHRYDPDRSLRPWLMAIARKRAIDQARRTHAVASAVTSLDNAHNLAGDDDRELSEQRASAALTLQALAQLPEVQMAVLHLAYFDGYTQTEIAALLRVPLGTVKTRTARGLRHLGRILTMPA